MAQIYEYTGVVEEVGQTQSFGSNGFTKREIIIGNDVDSTSKYPNPVKFTFKKDNCSLLDGIGKGQRAKVRFAIDIQHLVHRTRCSVKADQHIPYLPSARS